MAESFNLLILVITRMADEDECLASLEAKLEETKCALKVEKQAREKAEKQLTDTSRAFNKLYAVPTALLLFLPKA